ncbi:Putative nitrilase/cyanide hydratase [Mycobacteroides abscessus]|nr:Putative nitrilase/cyanide hydratase [Mycobacteroides abscessus]
MRIVLAQITSGADPTENLATVAATVRDAAAQGATLIVFPEATMCRFGVPLGPVAQPVNGRWADGVRAIADEAGLTVVVGMFTPAGNGRVHNTLLATGPGVDTHYNKIHLYDAFGFRESATVAPGHEPVLITVDGVAVGLTTCYDIRFPGLYTDLARRGAQVITVSASWAAGTGKWDQWTLLARARAADSTCFVAAADQALPDWKHPLTARPRGSAAVCWPRRRANSLPRPARTPSSSWRI